MPYIIRYRPVSNDFTTATLRIHENAAAAEEVATASPIEIARLDGWHYVAVPDGYTLPPQNEIIEIETVKLSPELQERLSNESHLIKNINEAVRQQIAKKYSISDEIKLLRTAPSREFDEWNMYVEEIRAWGRIEKAKLGL